MSSKTNTDNVVFKRQSMSSITFAMPDHGMVTSVAMSKISFQRCCLKTHEGETELKASFFSIMTGGRTDSVGHSLGGSTR